MTELFTREASNPILSAADWPYAINTVFNAAAAAVENETLLLARVEDFCGVSHFCAARSRNGIDDWRIADGPTMSPDIERFPEEVWGIEDPRLVWLEELGRWALTYTAFSHDGPLVSLALTADFETFERIGAILPPEDKDAVLFPQRFGGRWAMLHRPVLGGAGGVAHVWISFSPDLKHWGDHQAILRARERSWWDANKIGICTPPLRTEQGWLLLYHGVRVTSSGVLYRLGLALLDLDDPTRVIKRTDEWIFGARESYERMGDVPGVVFPCGWIVKDDVIRLYYGAADSKLCLAYGSVRQLLDFLDRQPEAYGRRRLNLVRGAHNAAPSSPALERAEELGQQWLGTMPERGQQR